MIRPDDDLENVFIGLRSVEKAAFLARVAHLETIHVRSAYHQTTPDVDAMIRSNELIHRVCGYIVKVLNSIVDVDEDRSVVAMILEAVGSRGQHSADELTSWLRQAGGE